VMRTWRGEGVQVVRSAGGHFCVEINPVQLSSGYFLAPQGLGSLLVNGKAVADPEDVPTGGEVVAGINPSSQRIWSAEFSYEAREGILEGIDAGSRQLRLLGDPTAYRLSSHPALSYADRSADVDPADYPFGGGFSLGWEELRPGLKVRLMLSRATGEVICVGAERDIVAGTIAEVDSGERRVVLSTGNSYAVPPGISIELDGRGADLSDLRPGYHLTGVLLPDTREVIAIEAESRVVYGRLVYINPDQGTLYLVDDSGDFRVFGFGADTRFYRFGIPVDAKGVKAGCWARLFLDGGGDVERADLAEVLPERREIFVSYDSSTGVLRTDEGSYLLSRRTLVAKNGYPVLAGDLVPGEELTLTCFLSGPGDEPLLASVSARTRPGVSSPLLEVAAPWRSGAVVISGTTSADRIYVRLPSGERMSVTAGKGGRFVCTIPLDALPAEGAGSLVLQVIAVDSSTGGVTGQFITVPAERSAAFPDLVGHWAAADVSALYAGGVVQGYPDGSFRPDAPITRAEFTVLLTKAVGWSGLNSSTGFADDQEIPAWARPFVAKARQGGLVHGYPDGRFLPDRQLSRAEAAVLLDAALRVFEPAAGASGAAALPWKDRERIPAWALPAVERLYAAGIMRGRSAEAFDPDAGMTRAEMAAAVCRLLEAIRSQ
ncbi:MAG: S-layer homology domain-containing protein, partial [Thermacetogeniaceae bacterium]